MTSSAWSSNKWICSANRKGHHKTETSPRLTTTDLLANRALEMTTDKGHPAKTTLDLE